MTPTVNKPYFFNPKMLGGISMANQKIKPIIKDGKAYLEIPEEMVSQLGLGLSPYYFEYCVLGDALLFKAKVSLAELLGTTEEQFNAQADSIELEIK